jgi:hypothetical protein
MKRQTGMTAIFREWKTQESRSILRLVWRGSLICFAEWSNLNLYMHQLLGRDYEARDLIRLSFRAIPETEDEYSVEAEIAVPTGVALPRVKPVHQKLARRVSAIRKQTTKSAPLSFEPVPIASHLTSEDQEILARFAALSTVERLRFWQDNVANDGK